MSGSMTEKLLADALEQAVGREGPPDGFSLVIHDDQGSRHSSQAFRRYLESHGIAKSMSRPVSLQESPHSPNLPRAAVLHQNYFMATFNYLRPLNQKRLLNIWQKLH